MIWADNTGAFLLAQQGTTPPTKGHSDAKDEGWFDMRCPRAVYKAKDISEE